MAKFEDGEIVKVSRGKYKGNRAKYIERVTDYGYVTPYVYAKVYVDEEFLYMGLKDLEKVK